MPRKVKPYVCIGCGRECTHRGIQYQHPITRISYKSCSKECLAKHSIKISHEIFPDGSDHVECAVCNLRSRNLYKHVVRTHGFSSGQEYIEKYGRNIASSDYLNEGRIRVSGDKNPWAKHDGKYSPWSDKNTAITDEDRLKAKKKAVENRTSSAELEYYTSRGMTEIEAIVARSERQRTFSLEKCIQRYGEEEGRKKWTERQEKWLKNYTKSNFSKVSQALFWKIYELYEKKDNVAFAELGDKKNNEVTLKLGSIVIKPDFIDTAKKKIIEFDGSYWHDKQQNPTREADRDNAIVESGYEVLHIKESEYKNDKKETIQRCLNFLNS